MNHHHPAAERNRSPQPGCRRLLLLALGILMLCSCRGQSQQHAALALPGQPAAVPIPGDPLGATAACPAPPSSYAALPAEAYGPAAALAANGALLPPLAPGMEQAVPLPAQPAGPWAPPEIARP